MSSTTLGQKGVEAVKNKDYAAAVEFLDKALESSNSPTWLLARAHANQQLKNYEAALQDAELAYHTAAERGSGNSRKLMIEAQYRRAIIYFRLGRYADSDCCAKWSLLLAEGRPARENDEVEKNVDEEGRYTVTYEEGVADKKDQPKSGGLPGMEPANKTGFEADWNRAYAWRSQVLGQMKSLPEDHPGRKVTVTKIPAKPEQRKVEQKPAKLVERASTDEPTKISTPPPVAPGSVPDEKLRLRIDFYQSNQNVTISLFAKDLKKDDLQVQFSSDQVRISPLPREAAPYVKPEDREATSTIILGGEIVPAGSRWSATPRKIELVLQKAVPGAKWKTWGEEQIGGGDAPVETAQTPAPTPAPATSQLVEAPAPVTAPKEENIKPAGPTYPTSSKSGPKNWDKLTEGEEDDDKSDVNQFFKELYKGATPEQQRAMMKSFVESNGTALSTDWNDVKSRTVETIPPEGVEAKKWENK